MSKVILTLLAMLIGYAVHEFVLSNRPFALRKQTFIHVKRTETLFAIAKFAL